MRRLHMLRDRESAHMVLLYSDAIRARLVTNGMTV
jgi:hypothetical protein